MQDQIGQAGPPQLSNWAEGENWFTQGEVVVPASLPVEALPKQPWDSYKPDFWAGIQIYCQMPLFNLPYFWEGTWYQNDYAANYSYFTATNQQVIGNARANQLYTTSAPTRNIYTGTDEPT